MRIREYQSRFLSEERKWLAAPGAYRADAPGVHVFRAKEADAATVAERFLSVMRPLNAHIEEHEPPPLLDLFDDPESGHKADAFWRARLPEWFTRQFPAAPDAGKPPALAALLSDCRVEERYWFYSGHETDGDALRICVDMSEPSGVYTLEVLIGFCGGEPMEEAPPLKAPRWLARLLGRD